MLKIKDNVDLKELEKYGFKVQKRVTVENYVVNINDSKCSSARLIVIPLSRKLIIETNLTYISDKLDILYDLIKADLVEKVSDE